MSKTTKTTRKTSATSGKKLSLKSRFSLRSKKVQFFVVIGIVAILGGGYYVRQSFAASAAWYYSLGYGNLQASIPANSDTCGVSPMTDTEKNRSNVFGVLCKAGNPANPGTNLQTTPGYLTYGGAKPTNAYFGPWAVGKNFRTCAVMRVTTDSTNVMVEQRVGSGYGFPSFVRTVGPIAKAPYSTVCTPWQQIYKPIAAQHRAGILPRSGGVTGGYIAELRIEQQ